jgi:hypothetical protein
MGLLRQRRVREEPVYPPFRSHAVLRLDPPALSARVVVGVDVATGRFVTAEQVDGNMRLLQEYAYDPATGQLGETVLVDGRVQFVASGEMAVARAPHWTPSDPPIDVEASPQAAPMPGGDLKVNRHQWTRGGGPDLSERLENLRAPGPTLFGGDLTAHQGPIQVCSMGDNALEYGGTTDGRGYSVLSREQWQRMLKLCRDGEE